jgi:hypothetical protein
MNHGAHPNPAQVPTLTEVIDLLQLMPVDEAGMHSSPRPAAPAPGTPGSAPIVTGGLAASQTPSHWTPMSTVVLSGLDNAPVPPMVSLRDVPLLDAVVAEPGLDEPGQMQGLAPAIAPGLTPGRLRDESVVVPDLPAQGAQSPVAWASADAAFAPSAPVGGTAEPDGLASPAGPAATLPEPVAPAPLAPAPAPAPIAPTLPDVSEAQLAQRVLADVQKQIDGMLDFRLREAIAPILARHSEALVRDLRDELKRTMQDVVTRSVAQEMAKLRLR